MSKFLIPILALLIAFIILSGCASSPPTKFYALQPQISERPANFAVAEKKLTIGIGPVELPKLLDRTQIVTRHADNQVHLAEFHQWSEPLDANVTRVLTQNLAALRPNAVIRSYPWGAFGSVDYRIVINFLQFDATSGQSVGLEADWIIMDEKSRQIVKNGHTNIETADKNQSYQAIVNSLSKTLGLFGHEMSNSLNDSLTR